MLSLFLATFAKLTLLALVLSPFSFPLGDHVGRGWAMGAGLKGIVGVGVGAGCVV